MNATKWFRFRFDGDYIGVARWYWPQSTRCEANHGNGWFDDPLLLELTEDPDWHECDEETAEQWVSAAADRITADLAGQKPV